MYHFESGLMRLTIDVIGTLCGYDKVIRMGGILSGDPGRFGGKPLIVGSLHAQEKDLMIRPFLRNGDAYCIPTEPCELLTFSQEESCSSDAAL